MDKSTTFSASEIARRIHSGEISAVDVVEAHIRRIEEVNPRINAVVIPLFDEARRQAREADAAQRRGQVLGPLHGVPVTIKEQFLVKGTATSFGLLHEKDHRAEEDGPLIKRLRDAGAIILGKTNTSQLLVYIESDNPVYGRSNNPWNLDRTPGGSSGGEAAIIAAGGSPLGLGGDVGGSIREPAHFCGIHGLKPTSGRLTNFDTRPGFFSWGLTEAITPQPGPMARNVEDLGLAMRVLAAPGQERFDPSVPPLPWPEWREVPLEGLRVAVYTDDGYFSVSPAIRRVVGEAADALRARGVTVEDWTPPVVEEGMRFFFACFTADNFQSLRSALGSDSPAPQLKAMLQSGSIPTLLRKFVAASMRRSGQERLARIVLQTGGRDTSAYWKLLGERNSWRMRFLRAMDAGRFDAILCPPTSLPAIPHGSSGTLLDFDSYARLFNVLGMPAGVVAAGRVRQGEESDRPVSKDPVEQAAARAEENSAGLPVGVQVAARHWREDVVLALMHALEQDFRVKMEYPSQVPL